MTLADIISDAIRDELAGRGDDLHNSTIEAIAENITRTLRNEYGAIPIAGRWIIPIPEPSPPITPAA